MNRPGPGAGGEAALVAALRDRFAAPGRLGPLELGIGDDAAAWRPAPGLLSVITQDVLVDGVHFRRPAFSLADVGRRSLAVNLADIAAMGATPRLVSVGLGLPDDLGADAVLALYDGMEDLLAEHAVAVSGGDVTRAPVLVVAITAVGEAATVVRRDGGRPGDVLAVTGDLGGTAAGVAALYANGQRNADAEKRVRHPVVRLREGRALAAAGATAMCDCSDGLGADAPRLAAASGTGLHLRLGDVPLGPGATWRGALSGGEDHELLVALPPDRFAAARAAVAPTPLTAIGELTAEPGRVTADDPAGHPIARAEIRGYDHLA